MHALDQEFHPLTIAFIESLLDFRALGEQFGFWLHGSTLHTRWKRHGADGDGDASDSDVGKSAHRGKIL